MKLLHTVSSVVITVRGWKVESSRPVPNISLFSLTGNLTPHRLS